MKYKRTYRDNLEQYISQNPLYVYGLIAFISSALLLVYFLPALVRMDVYSDDVYGMIPWYYTSQDPELFQDDLIKDATLYFSSLGYKTLFRLASTLVDPQIFAELLPFVLASCTIYFAYAVGCLVTNGSQLGGIANIGLFLFGQIIGFHSLMQIFGGGTPRAFGPPILFLGIWALLSRNLKLLSLALILAALFYPPVFLSLLVYSGMILSIYSIKERRIVKGSSLFAGTVTICLCLLLWSKFFSSGPQISTAVFSLDDILKIPDFYPGGIAAPASTVLFEDWMMYLRNAFPSNLLLFFAVTILFLWRAKIFRLEAVISVVSWLVLYTVSYLVIFKLYIPFRYVALGSVTFYFIVFPSIFLEAIDFFEIKFRNYRPGWLGNLRLRRIVTIILVVGITISSGTLTLSRISKRSGGSIGSAPDEVYDFLGSLPKNVMIAAHPLDANHLPIRSKRKTLVMGKGFSGIYKDLHEEMEARTSAIWAAMYATDLEPILSLRDKYHVDILLINRQRYEQEPFQESKPLDKIFQKFKANLKGRKPLLFSLPKETIIFRSGDFFVFDLRRLDKKSK